MALETRIRWRMQLEADRSLDAILETHVAVIVGAHTVNAVCLHELEGGVEHIVGSRQRTALHDTQRLVDLDPLRTEAAVVVGVGVVDIPGLADEVLAAGESENIDGLHLD
jgi:hypothetical protein